MESEEKDKIEIEPAAPANPRKARVAEARRWAPEMILTRTARCPWAQLRSAFLAWIGTCGLCLPSTPADGGPRISDALARLSNSEPVQKLIDQFHLKPTRRTTTEFLDPPSEIRQVQTELSGPGIRLFLLRQISARYDYEFCNAIEITPDRIGMMRNAVEQDAKLAPLLLMTNYASIRHDLPPDSDTVNKRGTGALIFPPPNGSIGFELFCSNVVSITISCIFPRERVPGLRLK